MTGEYAACPKCGGSGAELVKFSWWGGVLGPKMLTHVKCPSCGKKYNGKSGKENTAGIVVYSLVVGILSFILMLVAVFFIFKS